MIGIGAPAMQSGDMNKVMHLLTLALTLAATGPALAQFPPPGVYLCVNVDGRAFGTLALSPAGDYQFQAADGISGSGQLASSGQSVNALSGPLADLDLTGSFTTEGGKTSFLFSALTGSVYCGPPAK